MEQSNEEDSFWDTSQMDFSKPFVIQGLAPKISLSYLDWNANCFTDKLVYYCSRETGEYESQDTLLFIDSVKAGKLL